MRWRAPESVVGAVCFVGRFRFRVITAATGASDEAIRRQEAVGESVGAGGLPATVDFGWAVVVGLVAVAVTMVTTAGGAGGKTRTSGVNGRGTDTGTEASVGIGVGAEVGRLTMFGVDARLLRTWTAAWRSGDEAVDGKDGVSSDEKSRPSSSMRASLRPRAGEAGDEASEMISKPGGSCSGSNRATTEGAVTVHNDKSPDVVAVDCSVVSAAEDDGPATWDASAGKASGDALVVAAGKASLDAEIWIDGAPAAAGASDVGSTCDDERLRSLA